MKKLLQDKYFGLLIGLLLAYLALFFALDFASESSLFADRQRHIIHCALDDLIPFNEWFAIPYFIWFLAFPGSLLFFLLLDKRDFADLCLVVFGGAVFCFAVYLLWPNGLQLRPEPAELNDNLLCRLMQLVWLVDAPNNVCPSLHVSISCAIGLVTWRSLRLRPYLGLRLAVAGLMLLICISTVFVKQHSVLDVAAGILLSSILYLILKEVVNRGQSRY